MLAIPPETTASSAPPLIVVPNPLPREWISSMPSLLSVVALAVAAGAELRDAAVLANAAAGVVVGKLGTASVTGEELTGALAEAR